MAILYLQFVSILTRRRILGRCFGGCTLFSDKHTQYLNTRRGMHHYLSTAWGLQQMGQLHSSRIETAGGLPMVSTASISYILYIVGWFVGLSLIYFLYIYIYIHGIRIFMSQCLQVYFFPYILLALLFWIALSHNLVTWQFVHPVPKVPIYIIWWFPKMGLPPNHPF